MTLSLSLNSILQGIAQRVRVHDKFKMVLLCLLRVKIFFLFNPPWFLSTNSIDGYLERHDLPSSLDMKRVAWAGSAEGLILKIYDQ